MASYRQLPWKRNYRVAPQSILTQIEALTGDLFYVGATKTITAAQIESGDYEHLELATDEGAETNVLPPGDLGPYSTKNREGWEVVRRDLPKITKTFYWESPNFGDASTYGTHFHSQDREVFQREFHEPRGYRIVSSIVRSSSSGRVVHARVDQVIDRGQSDFQSELLFQINLLQESFGAIGAFSVTITREEIARTLALDWEIFPPGTAAEVTAALTRGTSLSSRDRGVMEDRIRLFAKQRPRAYLRGTGGFGSYVGAMFADDLVVFENVRYGNALYVLYEDWADVSRRSRIDLIRGTDAVFTRFPHTAMWEEGFEEHMRKERRKRRL